MVKEIEKRGGKAGRNPTGGTKRRKKKHRKGAADGVGENVLNESA